MAKVLRIFCVVALLVVVVAGCGGSVPQGSAVPRIPRALAQEWEGRASAIANAAAAGNRCEARHLAASLRDDVVTVQGRVPARLRPALLSGVNALADRTSCPHVVTVPAQPNRPPKGPKPKPPKPPKPHGPPGHKGHDGHGDGNDQ